jgi:Protein of unknown function (DUF3570)
MRKISLSVLVLFLGILSSFAQKARTSEQDSIYKSKTLKIEEANLVSSYYTQDGNNSAVTGGIGTEKLTDFSNTFDLKLSRYGISNKKHTIGIELGVDTYTSASSDMIEANRAGRNGSTRTSASYQDVRVYPSVNWQVADENKGISFGTNASFSTEYDYKSFGGGINFTKTSKDKSREIGAKLNAFFDTWMVIYPAELRPAGYGTGDDDGENVDFTPRNTFNFALTYAQIINKRFQMAVMLEPTYQQGLLATKYQRVYFNNGTAKPENLPDQRKKLPLSIRGSYFMGDRFIVRAFYRFYTDDWGLTAHTINIEPSVKLTPYFSVSPFYRFYKQTEIDYFEAYKEQAPTATYFTSDYDLSKLTSHSVGAGIRYVPPYGVLGIPMINSIELRYAHYRRSTDLISNMITIALKIK